MQFRILGPLELSDENGVVELAGSKQRALLAVLLLHANSVVSSDRLLDDLWVRNRPRPVSPLCRFGSRSCGKRSARRRPWWRRARRGTCYGSVQTHLTSTGSSSW